EANRFPIEQPSASPRPTYPAKSGRCPEPPPVAIVTRPRKTSPARMTPRSPSSRRSRSGYASTSPSTTSSTKSSGALMSFCILRLLVVDRPETAAKSYTIAQPEKASGLAVAEPEPRDLVAPERDVDRLELAVELERVVPALAALARLLHAAE